MVPETGIRNHTVPYVDARRPTRVANTCCLMMYIKCKNYLTMTTRTQWRNCLSEKALWVNGQHDDFSTSSRRSWLPVGARVAVGRPHISSIGSFDCQWEVWLLAEIDWTTYRSTEFSRHRNLSTCTICAAAWPLALRSCGMLRRKRRKMPHVAAPRRIRCERSFQHITTTTGPTFTSLYCVRHKGHHRLHHPRHQDVF